MNPRLLLLVAALAAFPPSPGLAQDLEIPPESAADVAFPIRASGLSPGELVTLHARMADSLGHLWMSGAAFRAGADGRIDTAADSPVVGSYSGIRPLGLLTSMDVEGESHGRLRFVPGRLDSIPATVVLEREETVTDSMTVIVRVLDPRVRIAPIEGTGFTGSLFIPPGRGPFPATLVIGGSEGGIGGRDVAAILAGRGILTLAIAYFGAEGLRDDLREIPLEAFVGAIDALLDRAESNDQVAIVGTSKGSEAALLVAARDPRIRAVVAYAPSHVAWSCICDEPERSSWTWHGEPLPFVPPGRDPSYEPPAGAPLRPVVNFTYRLRNAAAVEAARIDVEQIDGPLFLIAGEDDQMWPSAEMAKEIVAHRGRREGDVVLIYPGAGHLIGKTFLPAGSTLVAGGRLETGGSPAGNAAAQGDAWQRALLFLQNVFGS